LPCVSVQSVLSAPSAGPPTSAIRRALCSKIRRSTIREDEGLQHWLASAVQTARRSFGAQLRSRATMELNRNQYFFMGMVVLLLGIQVRNVASYTLTAQATKFLADRTQTSTASTTLFAISNDMGAGPQKVIQPPEWLGWCLMSVGSVLILHSLAMKKPGA
jgi:hypothetical protein